MKWRLNKDTGSRKTFMKWLGAGLCFILLMLTGACSGGSSFNRDLSRVTSPYGFNYLGWEVRSAGEALARTFKSRSDLASGSDVVRQYFSLNDKAAGIRYDMDGITIAGKPGDLAALQAQLDAIDTQKQTIESEVERVLAGQIQQVLADEGIYNPFLPVRVSFPMVSFRLNMPPGTLIISPLDHISLDRAIMLRQGLDITDAEKIEEQVGALGVSSIVMEPGGFGAIYPTMIDEYSSLEPAIILAIHEWMHQYTVFRPLGFLFLLNVLGIRPDYQIDTMNETLNDMVAGEVGTAVMARYYPAVAASHFQRMSFIHQAYDFYDDEMSAIRAAVDDFLSREEIAQAEQYMEEKRQELVANGYYIRKLNQAYFAFSGSYADTSPTQTLSQLAYSFTSAWTTQEIGQGLSMARSQSESLKSFLDRVSSMTSPDDLPKG